VGEGICVFVDLLVRVGVIVLLFVSELRLIKTTNKIRIITIKLTTVNIHPVGADILGGCFELPDVVNSGYDLETGGD
jgi:hypothetical protein